MFPEEKISELKKLLDICVKCGMCQAVCPVYSVNSEEADYARGKITLLKEIADGNIELDHFTLDAINRCTTCASCQAQCKNDIEFLRIITAARREIREKKGLKFIKKVSLGILANRTNAEQGARYLNQFQSPFRKSDYSSSGINIKFPIPGIGDGLYLPPMADVSFIEAYSGEHKARDSWAKIGFFVGCSSSFILPEIAESIIKYFVDNGVTVVVPKNQVCCGTPHYLSGDSETANNLLIQNTNAFSSLDIDAIVTGCPTCSGGLKEAYDFRDKQGRVIPVFEFSEFVFNNVERFKLELIIGNEKVTWHDPCHLIRLQKISKQPRALLKAIAGDQFVEMDKPDSCCGFGGVFSAAYPGTSMKIAKKKANRIERSGADIVVTACPGCVLFLRLGNSILGKEYKVIHLSQFMLKSMKREISKKKRPLKVSIG